MMKTRLGTLAMLALAVVLQGAAWGAQIPACKGVSVTTTNAAQAAAESDFCKDAAACITGTTKCTRKVIGNELKTIATNVRNEFKLSKLCAYSLGLVVFQEVIDGKLSAGSCPAP